MAFLPENLVFFWLNSHWLFFCFLYQKTRAFHRLNDDVPAEVKKRRLEELIAVFREEAERVNKREVGNKHLVLVEGVSTLCSHWMDWISPFFFKS